MKSVMSSSQHFAQAPTANIERSTFDRSHGWKDTLDADLLQPFYVDEVLPGDTFRLNSQIFGRLATPINPIFDNMSMDTFFFFVPTRLVWDNFKKFMGEQDDPTGSTDYTIPKRTSALTPSVGSVCDKMGLPTGVDIGTTGFNVLPFRAFWKCYEDWFKDQNLVSDVGLTTDDTQNVLSIANWNQLPKRAKKHDYFTSCLPWTQKINDGTSVSVPLSGEAWVTGIGPINTDTETTSAITIRDSYEGNVNAGQKNLADHYNSGTDTFYIESDGSNIPQIRAMLDSATGANINQLRLSFQLQKFFEKDARSGTRYNEKVFAHFGVTVPDYRLQRAEYLGGSQDYVNVSPVAQTSSTDATTPQGNLSAIGTVSSRSGFTKSFTEHGYVIGIVNVKADLTYQQGLNKMWSRETVYDFYWPSFAHLGEEPVLNKEIYCAGGGASADEDVFGYQERYSSYRYKPSEIRGEFRSAHTTPLDSWHLSEEFTTRPALNSTFIESNTPVDRVIAVTTEPHFILDGYIDLKCTRPMPVHGVPGLIDHF